MPSFDVVSKINMMELDNALNQARKEISTRFDFQGTKTELELSPDKGSILIRSASEGRVQAAYEVLQTKLAKRGVPLRAFTWLSMSCRRPRCGVSSPAVATSTGNGGVLPSRRVPLASRSARATMRSSASKLA